jgi:hypothetical protein
MQLIFRCAKISWHFLQSEDIVYKIIKCSLNLVCFVNGFEVLRVRVKLTLTRAFEQIKFNCLAISAALSQGQCVCKEGCGDWTSASAFGERFPFT